MKQSKHIAATAVVMSVVWSSACFNLLGGGGGLCSPPPPSPTGFHWAAGAFASTINPSQRWRNGGGAVSDSLSLLF